MHLDAFSLHRSLSALKLIRHSPVFDAILNAPAEDADNVVDGGQGVVFGKDVAACVGVQLLCGVDAAADWATC